MSELHKDRRKPGRKSHWETHPPRVVEIFTGERTEEGVWAAVLPPLAAMLHQLRVKRAREAAEIREDDAA